MSFIYKFSGKFLLKEAGRMNMTERTRIVSEGNLEAFTGIAAEVMAGGGIKVIREPVTGLVMMRVRDSVEGKPFNLGEVLITEAVVEMDNCCGYGFAQGDAPDRAMCMAVLEAALAAGHPLAPVIREVLEKEALALAERKKREAALIDRTRVNFETMEG